MQLDKEEAEFLIGMLNRIQFDLDSLDTAQMAARVRSKLKEV